MAVTIDGTANTITANATLTSALSTASGSAPSYSARAWVNFNGTGTVAIRASGNVSSITDNSAGNYTVNFTNAMQDANYVLNATSELAGNAPNPFIVTLSTGSANLYYYTNVGTYVDVSQSCVAIFR